MEPHSRVTGRTLTQGYIRFFEPDVYVEAQSGLAHECGIDTDSNFGFHRVITLDKFVTREDDHSLEFAFGLSIFDLYQDLYTKEYRFEPRHKRKVVLFEGRSADAAFFDAVSGTFPEDKRLGFLRQAYLGAFDPKIQAPNAENWIDALKSFSRVPFSFTRYGINHHSGGTSGSCVFVADPNSPLDMIDLWNLRQFQSNVLPFNVNWLCECKSYLREHIERTYRPLPGNPHGVMIRTTVEFGRSIDAGVEEKVSKTILNGLPPGSWSLKTWYDNIWYKHLDDTVIQREREVIEAKSQRIDLDFGPEVEPSGTVSTLSPEFAERFSGSNARCRWVNVLRLNEFSGKSGYALTLPSTPKKLMGISRRMSSGGILIVSREGFVLLPNYKDQLHFLRLFKGSQAITEWLQERGIEASPSDSGRIADQVINAVDGVWGAHILCDAQTIKLLDKMAKSIRVSREGDMVEEYPDRTAHVNEWVDLVKRRSKNSFPRLSVQSFVKAGALRLGLAIQCSNCEYENWYGIGHLDERLTCERCLQEYDFPQEKFKFGNTPWHYRVTGPFSVPDYANGAYSTVLTLRCLSSGIRTGLRSPITYSSNLNLGIDGKSIEIDFACWYARERVYGISEEPWFVVGETKSFSDEAIQAEDVRRLKLVGETLPGTVLIFAVLKEEISEKEKNTLVNLRYGVENYWLTGDGEPPLSF